MKFLMAQPALVPRYEFEVATAVDNLISLGVSPQDIILLFTDKGTDLPQRLKDKFGVQVFVYKDTRPSLALQYIPSIRPYLWYRFLQGQPAMQDEDFMYQDADVVYRQIPNFNTMNQLSTTHWYGSDTESYTGPDYINSKGPDMLKNIADFLGVTKEQMWGFKNNSVGAQWVISKPKVAYWKDVYEMSYKLYHELVETEPKYKKWFRDNGKDDTYTLQIWCSEMYAEAYLCAKYGITTEKSGELAFSWCTDKINTYFSNNILHNSGVTQELRDKDHLFFKGEYVNKSPFDEDLSWVNHDYCSWIYAQLVMATAKKFR